MCDTRPPFPALCDAGSDSGVWDAAVVLFEADTFAAGAARVTGLLLASLRDGRARLHLLGKLTVRTDVEEMVIEQISNNRMKKRVITEWLEEN